MSVRPCEGIVRFVDPRVSSFASIVLSLWTTAAMSQEPDTTRSRPAVIIGQVVDSVGNKVAGAEIMVLRADSGVPVVAPTVSDTQGTFRISGLPTGGPYTFIARKFGFRPARGRGITVAAGDTLRLRFVLNQLVVVLAPITAKARRDRYALYADEIGEKRKGHRDLLDLLAWRRPFMLGDPYMCSPLDSLGVPIPDGPRIRITRTIVFGGGGGRKPRPADAIRLWNGIDEPKLDFIRHVYVNGMRVDIPNDPIHTPARILRAIPMQHVAEMRYADCWDYTVPIDMQYSLFITLKPLPQPQADSIYRFILAQAAAAGPIEGRVMSVKRPSREQWDSIVRLLTGRDSTAGDSTAGDSASSASAP